MPMIHAGEHLNEEPLKIGLVGVDGQDGEIAMNPMDYAVEIEGHISQLFEDEYLLLELIAMHPDQPFSLFDVRQALPIFSAKEQRNPLDVVISLADAVPEIHGHLLAIVKSKTQYFSFLSVQNDHRRFEANLSQQLAAMGVDSRGNDRRNKGLERQRNRTIATVSAALGVAATATIVGYRYYRRGRKS